MYDELAGLTGAEVAGASGRGWGGGKASTVPPAILLVWQCQTFLQVSWHEFLELAPYATSLP